MSYKSLSYLHRRFAMWWCMLLFRPLSSVFHRLLSTDLPLALLSWPAAHQGTRFWSSLCNPQFCLLVTFQIFVSATFLINFQPCTTLCLIPPWLADLQKKERNRQNTKYCMTIAKDQSLHFCVWFIFKQLFANESTHLLECELFSKHLKTTYQHHHYRKGYESSTVPSCDFKTQISSQFPSLNPQIHGESSVFQPPARACPEGSFNVSALRPQSVRIQICDHEPMAAPRGGGVQEHFRSTENQINLKKNQIPYRKKMGVRVLGIS